LSLLLILSLGLLSAEWCRVAGCLFHFAVLLHVAQHFLSLPQHVKIQLGKHCARNHTDGRENVTHTHTHTHTHTYTHTHTRAHIKWHTHKYNKGTHTYKGVDTHTQACKHTSNHLSFSLSCFSPSVCLSVSLSL